MDFEDVYSRYSKDVFKFCLSLCGNTHIADDITSETFLKAIEKSDTFMRKCSVKAWLCQIAKNTYYDYLRKHSKITELYDDVPGVLEFEADLLDRSEALTIHKRLHRLNDPLKEVFSLRVFSELSFAEIADVFEKSESWARVTFHRAKLKLREALQDDKV